MSFRPLIRKCHQTYGHKNDLKMNTHVHILRKKLIKRTIERASPKLRYPYHLQGANIVNNGSTSRSAFLDILLKKLEPRAKKEINLAWRSAHNNCVIVCIKSFIHREKRGAHKKVPRGEIRRGEEDEERAESINVCAAV